MTTLHDSGNLHAVTEVVRQYLNGSKGCGEVLSLSDVTLPWSPSMRFWLSVAFIAISGGYLTLSLVSVAVIVVQHRQIPTVTVDFPDLWLDFSDGFLGGIAYQISLIEDAICCVCLSISLLLYFLTKR